MQIAVFAIALVVVFAIKAIAILKTHDELVANDASFSWMSARPEDEMAAAEWATEEVRMPEAQIAGVPASFRRVHA